MDEIVPQRLPQQTLDGAHQQLLTSGWAVLPDVLTPHQTSFLLSRLWKAKETSESRGESTRLEWLDPNASNVRVFNLLGLDAVFRDLIIHPVAIELVEAVLGPSFLISNFTANIARPGSQSMALHSDQSLVVPEPWHNTWALNCIWCLTDVTQANGATLFIPGSNEWVCREDVPADAPKMLVPFEAKAGSLILMDGRVWHTSGANVTRDEERLLLFGYYTAGFLRQQVNWTAKLEREVQEELGEQLKDWLGLRAEANVGPVGDLRYMSVQYPDVEENDVKVEEW